jgi:phosphinothricin acetyltransferase
MQVIHCNYQEHAQAMLDIINEAILNSTAVYDYVPRTMASMQNWFDAKEKGDFPVIGVKNEVGQLMGFASYGTFRAWPAYKYTVEHSIYIHLAYRRQGLARLLMQELILLAGAQQRHVMIGCIDMQNMASIALHKKLGFQQCGTLKQVGFKFGKWLDVSLYQLTLDVPAFPVDG